MTTIRTAIALPVALIAAPLLPALPVLMRGRAVIASRRDADA